MKDGEDNVNEHYKLEDWQSCCNLYLARGLVFEALDVIRMCVRNADSVEDKAFLLNFFYKGEFLKVLPSYIYILKIHPFKTVNTKMWMKIISL